MKVKVQIEFVVDTNDYGNEVSSIPDVKELTDAMVAHEADFPTHYKVNAEESSHVG